MHSQTELYETHSNQITNPSTSPNNISLLLEKISSLEQRIEKLHFHRQSNERSRNVEKYNRSSFRSRSRSRKRYDPKAESKLAVSSGDEELNNCCEFNYRLFVFDKKTGIKFLVDSGANVSLILALCGDKVIGDFKLYAAIDTEIPCFGHKILPLDLELRRDFQWPFIIAKVNKGILGADFLRRFNLLIDIKNKKLIDGVTKLSIIGEITSSADELNDLKLCSHVFVRVDRVKKALEYPNEGPFPVDARNEKYTLKTKGKDINVSVDRLKQAYLLDSGEDDFRNLTNKEKENTQLNGDDNVKMEYTKFKTSRSERRITFQHVMEIM
ncbi:RT_RNaseH_2 domain-containing protein [Nephila pilipes]|uniref:RT_RNaseH_2 domain-containing protein n=1 Tax=Nephila pilipes TaxID=299642 RepID=A0A8X6MSW6_NEPPI|nr:RT_RNaseH_2 domain-containing protein [Nephila pilipes]